MLFRPRLFNTITMFLEYRAQGKFQQIMKATQEERKRVGKVEALKKSTIKQDKGIEEKSSAWARCFLWNGLLLHLYWSVFWITCYEQNYLVFLCNILFSFLFCDHVYSIESDTSAFPSKQLRFLSLDDNTCPFFCIL